MGTKIGLIGAGGITQNTHIPAFSSIPDVELAALADINEEKLDHVAKKFEIPASFTDWRQLLQSELDAVVICSPNAFHAEQSIEAMRAGKHVLCEKPVCLSTAEAEELLSVSRETGKTFMGAFQRRFSGGAKLLKKMIERGDFGDVYYLRGSWMRRRGIPGLGGWFTNRRLAGGGPMLDIGVHVIDLLVYLAGAPAPEMVVGSTHEVFRDRATAGGWPPASSRIGDKLDGGMDVEDLATGYARLKNGATLSVEASWASNIPSGFQVGIGGSAAGVLMSGDSMVIYSEIDGVMTDITPQIPASHPAREQAEYFIACVREGRASISRPEEILSVARIIEGIYRSAETGEPVFYR